MQERCWAYKHWSVSIDECYSVTGIRQSSQNKQMLPEWKHSLWASSLTALSCGSVQGGLSQHKPQLTGLTGQARNPGHLHQWCWHETSCARAHSCAAWGVSGVPFRSHRHGSSARWAVPASLICHNTTCLPPSMLVFCRQHGDTTAEQGSLHPSGRISAASFCSS